VGLIEPNGRSDGVETTQLILDNSNKVATILTIINPKTFVILFFLELGGEEKKKRVRRDVREERD
jgi:hypothetical protein